MPRVGNGVGNDWSGPTADGLSHVGGDMPEKLSGNYKNVPEPSGGAELNHGGGNRMAPIGSSGARGGRDKS